MGEQLTMSGRAVAWAAAGMSLCGAAQGAVITYGGTINLMGTGFGNTLNVLSLQATPNESGSVLRVGGVDVISGDAMPQSQTRSAAELGAMGVNASNLGIVFNISEPPGVGSDVTLQGFTVRFTDNTGNLLFDAVFSQTQVLDMVSGGVGGSGHLYNIALTAGEAASFFGSSTNRIGVLVEDPILNTADGPDNFILVPTPGGAVLLALAGLAAARRRRT